MTDERRKRVTPEQGRAIESEKKNVVVSASAGSGKTTTMVSRVVELIKEKKIKTREIAMMTFTEASAREMLSRLGDRLIEEIKLSKGEEREALVAALDELPFLSCGTIHSFCLKLIKSHFELLGISPASSVTDEDSADYFKKQAFKNLLKKNYEKDKESFLSFTRTFEENKDEKLEKCVFRLYDMMTTSEEREGYFARAKAIANAPLEETTYASYYLSYFKRRALLAARELTSFAEEARARGAKKYGEKIAQQLGAITGDCLNCTSLRDIFLTVDRLPKRTISVSPSENREFPELKARGDVVFKISKDFFDEMKNLVKDYGSFEALKKDYAESAKTISDFIDFTQAFSEEYAAIKEREKVLDYGDLEKYALELLARSEIRDALGFRYVLVDECQDVNPVQNTIIRLISEKGDLFTVGDVKQSIYRFRLADPALFLNRMRDAETDPAASEVILFDKNFRSSPAVVSFVNRVFSSIMTESFGGVDYKKHLLVGRESDPSVGKEGEVGIFFAPERERETFEVEEVYSVRKATEEEKEEEEDCPEGIRILKKLREIVGSELFDARAKKPFTVSYGDIAILAAKRNGTSMKTIRYLVKKGIPLNLGDFLKEEASAEEDQLVDLFRLLLSPADDYALLSVLRSPIFSFTSEEIAEIGREPGKTFYEKARAFSQDPRGERIREVFSFLDEARFLASVLPLDELAAKIVRERFSLPLLKESDGRVRLGKLLTFVRSIKGRKESVGLSEFISFYDENRDRTYAGEVEDKNAISVMTVHGSKGLEFPVVFLIGTGSSVNPSADTLPVLVDRDLGVAKSIADESSFENRKNFAVECVKKKKREESREDALRLLYVALTRAKNSLYVTGTLDAKRYASPSAPELASSSAEWIAYATRDLGIIERSPIEEESAALQVEETKSFDETDVSKVLAGFDYVYPHQSSTVTGIKYTVTGINSTDEEGFVPPTPLFAEDRTQRGVAFHAVMENLPLDVETTDDVVCALENLVFQGVLTEEEKAEIEPSLALAAAKTIAKLTEGMKVGREKSFMMLLPAESVSSLNFREGSAAGGDEVSVQGKIDLLALSEGRAIIVDYKLSEAPSSILKERYRAQLDLYELAVRKAYGSVAVEKYIFVLGRNELISL